MDIWNIPSPDPDFEKHQAQRLVWFKMISPEKQGRHWKEHIDCWIAGAHFAQCREACIYFTGSDLEFVEGKGNTVHVKAVGYYATIGA